MRLADLDKIIKELEASESAVKTCKGKAGDKKGGKGARAGDPETAKLVLKATQRQESGGVGKRGLPRGLKTAGTTCFFT